MELLPERQFRDIRATLHKYPKLEENSLPAPVGCFSFGKEQRGMKHVVYDCDNTLGILFSDVDDGLALLYLLAEDETVDLLGVTTTYGNSREEKVYGATCRMLRECGREDIPVIRGGDAPGQYDSAAADYLVEQANRYPGELCILATGSLTNLEGAFRKDPAFFEKVKEIVLMGGITEPLVFSKNTMDELNFSCDPQASCDVLTRGKDVSVVTGNNCLKVLFTTKEYRRKLYSTHTPAGDFIRDKADLYAGLNEAVFGIEGFYNWDVLAAVYLCHPEQFEDGKRRYTLSTEDLKTGFLRADEQGSSVLNLPEVREAEGFREHVYRTWLSADIAYRSRNVLPLRLLKRLVYPLLDRAVAVLYDRGKVGVKYSGEGIHGHGM